MKPDFLPPFPCGHARAKGNVGVSAHGAYCRECARTKNRRTLLANAQRQRPHLYPATP